MSETPSHLKDASQVLGQQRFSVGNVWYHGTSSALLDSILANGLRRSGDRALQDAAKQTMATIGNAFEETTEPVYLTPSRELAYFWAQQTVRTRAVRVGGDNAPAVLAVTLSDALNTQVKPDVGAATLLMHDTGEAYMAHVASIYQACGLPAPDIDLRSADRMAYLTVLGMAYIDTDIDPEHLEALDVNASAEH